MYEVTLKTSDGPLVVSFSDETLKKLCGSADSRKNRRLACHFLCCWLAILSDSPLDASCRKPRRLFSAFIRRLIDDGLLATIKRYSGLADSLMQSQHETGPADLTNQWVEGFCDTPVFKEYHSFYRTRSPKLFQYLLTFCLFGKKLKMENPEWHAIAFRDWQGVESRLSRLDLRGGDFRPLRAIVSYLVGPVDFYTLFPKFGPGHVAEPGLLDDIRKAVNLRFHPYLVLVLRHSNARTWLTDFFSLPERYRPLTSVLRLVPKDVTKSRSICMEENATMFVQQALFRALRTAMEVGPISQFVNLRDQSLNRRSAQYGSYSGDVDTIDLSSASDSVSVDLVRRIFPKEILFYLELTRSADVKTPDGSVVRVKKFAPMGSALCFPVQCIIFTTLAIYASMLQSGWLDMHRAELDGNGSSSLIAEFLTRFRRYEGYADPSKCQFQPLRVFGDDICIDSSLTTTLIKVLTDYGFVVNEGKSFMASSSVRESCGGYYFRGFDVTPLRYTMEGEDSKRDPLFAASSIALINSAGDRNFFALKKFCTHVLLYREGPDKAPYLFSRDRLKTFAIYSEWPKNDHLRSVSFAGDPSASQPKGCHAIDWQRKEYRCYTFMWKSSQTASPTEREAYDRYLYMRWWATRRFDEEQPLTKGARHRVTAGCRIRLAWTPD